MRTENLQNLIYTCVREEDKLFLNLKIIENKEDTDEEVNFQSESLLPRLSANG